MADDKLNEDATPAPPVTRQKRQRAEPQWTDEPIIGVPIEDVIAWVDSWDTPDELPEPKDRQVG